MNWSTEPSRITTEPDRGVIVGRIHPLEDLDNNADARVGIEQDFLGVRNLAEVPERPLDRSRCKINLIRCVDQMNRGYCRDCPSKKLAGGGRHDGVSQTRTVTSRPSFQPRRVQWTAGDAPPCSLPLTSMAASAREFPFQRSFQRLLKNRIQRYACLSQDLLCELHIPLRRPDQVQIRDSRCSDPRTLIRTPYFNQQPSQTTP